MEVSESPAGGSVQWPHLLMASQYAPEDAQSRFRDCPAPPPCSAAQRGETLWSAGQWAGYWCSLPASGNRPPVTVPLHPDGPAGDVIRGT